VEVPRRTRYEAPPSRSLLVLMGVAVIVALWATGYQADQLQADLDQAKAGLEVLRAKVATLEARP
jgi:hypothetical protein